MKTEKKQQEPIEKRRLTPQEQSAVTCIKQKRSTSLGPIFRSEGDGEKEITNLALAVDENLDRREAVDLMEFHILKATGAANSLVGLQLLTNQAKAVVPANIKGNDLANQLNNVVLAMQALAPQDEYEGQLVAQLVVLHENAMDWLGRAMRTDRVDFANIYLNGASKLLTRHHETLDALLKYRRRGEQRVVVEHVNVYQGGQAIVGSVTTGGAG